MAARDPTLTEFCLVGTILISRASERNVSYKIGEAALGAWRKWQKQQFLLLSQFRGLKQN